jgi:hypothetical protein
VTGKHSTSKAAQVPRSQLLVGWDRAFWVRGELNPDCWALEGNLGLLDDLRAVTLVYKADLCTEDSAWSAEGQRFVLGCTILIRTVRASSSNSYTPK